MVTTEIKTIKPAGGGDYSSLNTWEVAERSNAYPTIPNGDLVSADKIKVAEVYSGGNCLTDRLSINTGWTTDATRYIEIRAASGYEHNGIWDTNKSYGTHDTDVSNIITIHADVHINKMQFSSTQVASAGMMGLIFTRGNGRVVIDRCIIKHINNYIGIPLYQDSDNAVVIVTNSIVLLKQTSNGYTALCVKVYGQFTTYNSTFIAYDYNNGDTNTSSLQIMNSSAVITSENCYFKSSYVYWNNGGGTFNKGSKDATSSNDATDPNLRSIPYSTDTFQNVTFDSEDLRLVVIPSNKLINSGANLTAQGVTTDIVGVARPQFGAFDIGAFENDIPVCWNYTAQYKNSSRLFKASGCGSFPRSLRVPGNVDASTGRMVDDGVEIDPDEYRIG